MIPAEWLPHYASLRRVSKLLCNITLVGYGHETVRRESYVVASLLSRVPAKMLSEASSTTRQVHGSLGRLATDSLLLQDRLKTAALLMTFVGPPDHLEDVCTSLILPENHPAAGFFYICSLLKIPDYSISQQIREFYSVNLRSPHIIRAHLVCEKIATRESPSDLAARWSEIVC